MVFGFGRVTRHAFPSSQEMQQRCVPAMDIPGSSVAHLCTGPHKAISQYHKALYAFRADLGSCYWVRHFGLLSDAVHMTTIMSHAPVPADPISGVTSPIHILNTFFRGVTFVLHAYNSYGTTMKKTILLIDDDESMLQLTTELLEHEGYAVMAASTGHQALELTERTAPDLVLCDVTMPGIDGFGVLQALGETPHLAETPFIFLSARAERADVRKGMEMGADDYLTKPFQAKELLHAVESRLKRSEIFRRTFTPDEEGLDEFLDQARCLEVLKNLSRDRKTRLLKEQEILFREGDELDAVAYIVKGKLRTYNVNKDGKEFTTGLHSEGDLIGFFGLLEHGRSMECAEALEPSKVVLIPNDEMFALLQKDHDVSACFIKLLSRDVEEMKGRMLQLAYASIRQRVAQSLLRIQERYAKEDDASLGVSITRDDLASVVGTATESLIRSLADLKEDLLINVDGRNIQILNKPGLEKVARF